jgi:DNA-binding response OmpR family regulator
MSPSPERILLVDDNPVSRGKRESLLRAAGFSVMSKTCGHASSVVLKHPFDLLILSLSQPMEMCEQLCRTIRESPRVQALPILILTGDDSKDESIRWMDTGADAYLLQAQERGLLTHIRALLRRPRIYMTEQAVINKGSLTMEMGPRRIFWKGRPVKALTPKEFEMLQHMVMHTPTVIDKETLALKVWGIHLKHLHERSLDVHVRRIRIKLGPDAAVCLKTVPSIGYQWVADERTGFQERRRSNLGGNHHSRVAQRSK